MADDYIPSILTSVKKSLGIEDNYTHFDPELIDFINMALSILFQLGVGPQDVPFRITDKSSTWDDLIGDKYDLNMIKSEVFIRVKQLFDPPTSSHLSAALKEQLLELDWRTVVAADEEVTNA